MVSAQGFARQTWPWSFLGALAGVAGHDRLYRRPGRRRHDHRGAVARGVHRHRRHRPDVRHHARARQCRSLPARQYRPRQRRRDEGHGRQRFDGGGRTCSPLLAAASAIGASNYLLIWALRIPPIIATLSASFIIQSADISYGRGLQIKPPPGFADFTNLQLFGIPVLADPHRPVHHWRGHCAAADDLWTLRTCHRAEHPRSVAGGRQCRPHPVSDLHAFRRAGRSGWRAAGWVFSRRQCRYRQ